MKTTFEKLSEKIKLDLGREVINFRRCYAGHHQRSGGAFVWDATDKVTGHSVGSTFPATELLKSKTLIWGYQGFEIYPYEADNDKIS